MPTRRHPAMADDATLTTTGALNGSTAARAWLAVPHPDSRFQRPFASRNKRRSAPSPNKKALNVFRDRAASQRGRAASSCPPGSPWQNSHQAGWHVDGIAEPRRHLARSWLSRQGCTLAELRAKTWWRVQAEHQTSAPLPPCEREREKRESSLEALQAYSLGARANYVQGAAAALLSHQRAIQLDANFAMGYQGDGSRRGTPALRGHTIAEYVEGLFVRARGTPPLVLAKGR